MVEGDLSSLSSPLPLPTISVCRADNMRLNIPVGNFSKGEEPFTYYNHKYNSTLRQKKTNNSEVPPWTLSREIEDIFVAATLLGKQKISWMEMLDFCLHLQIPSWPPPANSSSTCPTSRGS